MRSSLSIVGFLCFCAVVSRAVSAPGDELSAELNEFFERKVRPVLVEACFECHGADAQESGLRVDSRAALLKGGVRGPAIVPGDAPTSLLVRAIGHGETLQMPPKKKLARQQIADLGEWIKRGAPWPGQVPAESTSSPKSAVVAKPRPPITDKQARHWALQPLSQSLWPAPRDRDWVRSPVDAWILAQLEANQLEPAASASRRALLRRAAFDLTGLPPDPEWVESFAREDAPDAFARALDRLLASPRYGERYGRHWLDLARYADSNGLDENLAYANAFRYRDYVIAALNRDKPYDRFVQEQIAGDLLPHANADANADDERDGIVATGFLSLGAKMLAEDDPVKMQMDIIDEQIDTLGKCFLGLTLGCARCHDHKYDPVDMHDYYGLAGIFKSTKTMVNHNVVAVWQERPVADAATIARRDEIMSRVKAKRAEAEQTLARATGEWLDEQRSRAGDYLWAAHVRQRRQQALAALKPLGESLVGKTLNDKSLADAGVVLIEAEDYVRGNVNRDTTTYGQGIGVLVNRGETPNFVEYDVTLARAGAYRLELRYAAAAARPCKFSVGGRLALDGVAGQVTGSWQPDGQKWFVEGLVDLPAGKVTLRLEQPQFFPHIDKLLIAPLKGLDEPANASDAGSTRDGASGLGSAAIPAAESVANDLNAELVQQWVRTLAASSRQADSVFAPWHAWFARTPERPFRIESFDKELPRKVAERLAITAETSDRQVVERYAQWMRDALQALLAAPTRAGGERNATALADPVLEAFRQLLFDAKGPYDTPKSIETFLPATVRDNLARVRDEAAAIEKAAPKIPEAMAVSELPPEDVRIHFRGSHLTLGEVVPRGFPRAVGGDSPSAGGALSLAGSQTSGRLELARWLTRPDHPLVPRVAANRLWLWHFGRALVRSPDNFGLLGEPPTHPELLDWLARQLPEQRWSLKRLHRELMLSATYAMSSGHDERALAVDPENRWHWRFDRRRLSAEEIRDSILWASGRLNYKMGGSYLPIENRKYVTSTANVNPAIYDLACRSVYVPVVRSALYEVFQAFDFADPSVLAGQRESTTVAPQALFMLNSKITAEASRDLADQLLADRSPEPSSSPETSDERRVRTAIERLFGRPAEDWEIERSRAFVENYARAARAQGVNDDEATRKSWQTLCRALIASAEFVYVP